MNIHKNNMLSLYVHIPFCVRKCGYCGFYSTPYTVDQADDFLAAMRSEAELCREVFSARRISTIYVGGGTPTVLTLHQFEHLAGILRKNFRTGDEVEFTVEANPNTVTSEILRQLRELGVNRISLGVQSFSDPVLQTLGRLHTASQAGEACARTLSAGFPNMSIDLMYGIPGQTMAQWEESLDRALSLRPAHLSAYGLSLDEGSLFYRLAGEGNFALPDDDTAATMYECAVERLTGAGYDRYELSNFALPGYACRHNMNYWDRGEYRGLGPGAWSFVAGERSANIADTREYARRLSKGMSPVVLSEVVEQGAAARERILLSLRTREGLNLQNFEREYGIMLAHQIEENSAALREAGLLRLTDGWMRLTERGILLSNEVLARLTV